MLRILEDLAAALATSPAHALSVYLLGNVPGFPPIVQTVHIMSVAAIMGSIVLIDLRILGLALPSQRTGELVRRLLPWTWWALPTNAVSGLVFVLARPQSYVVNPVFRAKFMMLLPAVILALAFARPIAQDAEFWERSPGRRTAAKLIALCSLALWIGVVLAGRWIAYADYLFDLETGS
jgi:hypothetical protein